MGQVRGTHCWGKYHCSPFLLVWIQMVHYLQKHICYVGQIQYCKTGDQGPFPYNFFLCNLRPFCCKLRNFCNLWANLWSKFGRNHKSVIYGSVKFYGTGPWTDRETVDAFYSARLCRYVQRFFSKKDGKTFAHMGRESWPSCYGRTLMLWRSWVRIPAPYTGLKIFHIILLYKDVDGPFLKNQFRLLHFISSV